MATSSPVFEREPIVVPEGTPLVEFRDVSIGFEDHEVLQNVSFSVARGETRIILGPAGGGKSTLMKLTNGLLKPDSGEILVFGRALSEMSEREIFALRAHVGMVFQESALFDSLDVEDNVAYRLHEDHVPEEEAHERVVEALRFVEQRDVSKATSLLITHRLQDAFTLATHCWDPKTNHMEKISDGNLDPNTKFLILNDGHVVFDGTTRELTHSQDPWLKAYLA